jgi:hypothetical protein
MPQIVQYRVVAGLRSGGCFQTPALTVRVPDTAMPETVERELHAKMLGEWREALPVGIFDLEKASGFSYIEDHTGWTPIPDPDGYMAGRVAVAAAEVAWLQTVVQDIGPEQSDTPAGDGGVAGGIDRT